jgi:hypothetical protein
MSKAQRPFNTPEGGHQDLPVDHQSGLRLSSKDMPGMAPEEFLGSPRCLGPVPEPSI